MARTPRLGPKIDQYFKLRRQRLDFEKEADKIKKKESKLKDQLIESMNKQEVDSATGVLGTVSITRPEVPRANDWPAFYAWIRKNNAFELLQRRVNEANVAERLEQKPQLRKTGIPGIEFVKVVKFHATGKRGK